MGNVLKRRDNSPIVKDVYGGVVDILTKEMNIQKAIDFVDKCLQDLVDGIQIGKADAVLAASIFHYGEHSVQEAKEYMARHGVPVRM